MVDEGPAILRAVVGMDRKTGPLVHQEDVLVLIDDTELRGRHGQVGVVLTGLVEKLIIDIKLEHIALFQPGVPLRSCVVELDALDTDVFLGQRGGQQRHRLGQKTVQPLTGIVLFDFEFFHSVYLLLNCDISAINLRHFFFFEKLSMDFFNWEIVVLDS